MTEIAVVKKVINYLGVAVVILTVGSVYVLVRILDASGGRDTVDPAVIGLFASLTGLTGTAVGALGAMLVSTKTGAAEPQQVEVTNSDANAVPVEAQ